MCFILGAPLFLAALAHGPLCLDGCFQSMFEGLASVSIPMQSSCAFGLSGLAVGQGHPAMSSTDLGFRVEREGPESRTTLNRRLSRQCAPRPTKGDDCQPPSGCSSLPGP